MRNALRVAIALRALAVLPASAAEDCTADLANAHARIAAIQARDPKIDTLMKQKNVRAVCAILRTNIVDMTAARDAMARCLPDGFEKNEDVTNLNANLADLSDAVAQRCR
jgi:hypothetical protein